MVYNTQIIKVNVVTPTHQWNQAHILTFFKVVFL